MTVIVRFRGGSQTIEAALTSPALPEGPLEPGQAVRILLPANEMPARAVPVSVLSVSVGLHRGQEVHVHEIESLI